MDELHFFVNLKCYKLILIAYCEPKRFCNKSNFIIMKRDTIIFYITNIIKLF